MDLERILVVSGVNEAELLRTLCWHKKDSFALRVESAAELAVRMLTRQGIVLKEKPIGSGEQICLMMDVLDKCRNSYFPNDYDSVSKLCSSLDMLRLRIRENESEQLSERLPKGKFEDKNAALLEAYSEYIKECRSQGVIDRIGLVRKAAELCERAEGVELLTLKEYPLQPAELALTDRLSGAREITLAELFGARQLPRKANVFSAYGAVNEVRHVLETILKGDKETRFDCCTVAVADTALYPQLFFELGRRYGIAMSFGCGIPFGNTTAAAFLKSFVLWNGAGMNSGQSLDDWVFGTAFDRSKLTEKISGKKNIPLRKVTELAGALRLSCDEEKNSRRLERIEGVLSEDDERRELLGALKAFSGELSKGVVYLLRNYCTIRKNELGAYDRSAVSSAASDMTAYEKATGNSAADIIPKLICKSVGRTSRKEGTLHITAIKDAAFSLRDKLFICGLSADNYPGSPKEDPIVLDCDIELFDTSDSAPTSDNVILGRKEQIKALVQLASALGSEITLSYSNYRAADLKKVNMSSVVSVLYNSLVADESEKSDYAALSSIKPVSYFDDPLTADSGIGKSYCAGELIDGQEIADVPGTAGDCLDKREYSPSELVMFFECPRKFYFRYVLGIKPPEQLYDFNVFEANEKGTIIHEAMEEFANGGFKMNRSSFAKLCSEIADRFVRMKAPISESIVENEKEKLLKTALRLYDMDLQTCPKQAKLVEKDLHIVHDKTGVALFGKPDRLEERGGKYYIADFKTGRHIKQKDDQPKTWLQTLCYAYMSECNDSSVAIEECEYIYPQMGRREKRKYDRAELDGILQEFAQCVRDGYFPRCDEQGSDGRENPAMPKNNKDEDRCAYCAYGGICGREE